MLRDLYHAVREPVPPPLQQSREWLERRAQSPNDVYWAIWTHDQAIGLSAITDIEWHNRHAETSSWIGPPEYREHGYGGEAMRLRTRFAFHELGLEKLIARAHTDNVRSIRGLQRAGYRGVGIQRHHTFSDGHWHDSWLGEVVREEWERQQ